MTTAFARVGDLAQQIRGVTYSKSEAASVPAPGFLPILRAGNITEHGLTYEDLVYVPESRVNTRQRIRCHDVLIAASSGSLKVVGKAGRAAEDFDGGFGAFCKVLRPNDRVDPHYFAQFFQTAKYRRTISSLAAGANINNLRSQHLDDLEIPLPPVEEQRRIAAILDQADALRAKRREALAHLDDLTQSIFFDMFGDPVSPSHRWPKRRIGDVAQVQIGPFGSLLHSEDYVDDGVPLINPIHIVQGTIVPNRKQSVTKRKHSELENYQLRVGDVIMGRRGEMGRCAIVGAEHDGLLCGTGSLIIRPQATRARASYLAAALSHPSMKRHFEGISLGSTLPNLNRTIVANVNLVIPPIQAQAAFEERLGRLANLRGSHDVQLVELDSFFASLQSRAFAGEL